MHKYLFRFAGVLTAIALLTPVAASAQATTTTPTDLQSQIQSLLSEIQSLQQQIKTLIASAASTTSGWSNASTTPSMPPGQGIGCASFSRDLSEGDSGNDVSSLQQLLSDQGFLSASSTGFFGPLTARALARFQEHFGIASSSATGFFGPMTRGFMSRHCGEDGQSTPTPFSWGEGERGTSTPPFVWNGEGSTTIARPDMPTPPYFPLNPASTTIAGWVTDIASSSVGEWESEHASTTISMPPVPPMQPCGSEGEQGDGLFVPHVILPGMFGGAPCGNSGGDYHNAPMIPYPATSSHDD